MLYDQIKKASLEARKTKDTVTANLLGLVLADIQNRAKEAQQEPSDEHAEAALKRAKKMNDQAVALNATEQLTQERKVLDQFIVQATSSVSEQELNEIIGKLFSDNPDKVATVKEKPQNVGWFVGQVMKATGGKANPAAVKPLIEKALAE